MTQINLLMFFFYLTLGSALPYIPLYYRKLGLSDSKIGMLGAITPTMNLIASPLWGALADSKQWHKEIMVMTFVLSVITRYGLFHAKGMSTGVLVAVVSTTAILNAPVKPLMDSAVMDLLPSKNKSAYGRSRFYGQVGFGLGSYLVSPLIGSTDNIKHIFHAHLLAAIPAVLLMASFKPGEKVTSRRPLSAASKMREALDVFVKNQEVMVFFTLVFLVGLSSGIIENFAYVRISEVGGETSGNILGTIRLISSIAGGPMFWLSGRISKRIGPYGILALSLLSYTLRFFIYALIQSPWQALPAELLRGLVFAVFWAGCTLHVYEVAPKGLVATMLAVLNAVYGGLGQSAGALVGGQIIRRVGNIKDAFLLCGVSEIGVLASFLLYLSRTKYNAAAGNKKIR